MNIACPECSTVYRIDPDRVPEGGAVTVCRSCDTSFAVEPGLGPTAPGTQVAAPRAEEAVPAGQREAETEEPGAAPSGAVPDTGAGASGAAPTVDEEATPATETAATPEGEGGAPVFGPQDPETRARRLARALVSDIKVYHPEKWEESAAAGTLRNDFRDEILKSWEEYVEQVGEEMAKKTPYFRDALNDILAQGKQVF